MGLSVQQACTCAGVHTASFSAWRKKGREQKVGIYADFIQGLKAVEYQLEQQRQKRRESMIRGKIKVLEAQFEEADRPVILT